MAGGSAEASVAEPEISDVTPQMLFSSMSDMVEKRPKGISRKDWFQNRCASMTSRQDMSTGQAEDEVSSYGQYDS